MYGWPRSFRFLFFRACLSLLDYNFISMATTLTDTFTARDAALRHLRASDCVLAVVDIQEKLLPAIFDKDRVVRNSQLLIRLAGILGIPAVVTTQYSRGLGPTIPQIASLLPRAAPIDKLEF